MKKTLKKAVAVFLATVMVLCTMPFTALAADGVRTIDTATLTTLNSRITGYENKINNNTSNAYYNMQDAYNKYTYAMAVKDAANYGSLTDQNAVDTAASDLYTAYNTNLKAWSAYSATGVPKFGTGSSQPSTNYYSNILYADGSSETSFSSSNAKSFNIKDSWVFKTYQSTWYIYYPNTTLMYDGNAVKFPAIVSAKDVDGDHYPNYIAVTTNDFSLSQDWLGHNNGLCWPSTTSVKSGYSANNSYNHDNCWHINDTSNYQSMRNYINYTGAPTNTLTTVSGITFSIKCQFQYTLAWPDSTNNQTTSREIHIINYKKLIDKVSDKKSLWTTTAKQAVNGNYREGGFSAFMGSLDTIGFDPNSFFTSSNNYNGCVSAIDSAVSALDSPAARTADTHQTAYEALRTAEMQNDGKGTARSVYAAGNTKWTTSSWNTFKSAFEAVMDKFDAVVNTSSKSFSYTLSNNDATPLANALNAAYAGLDERADFTDIDTDSAVTKNAADYTYETYKAFRQAKQTVDTYHAYDATARADVGQKANESKVDQTDLNNAHTVFNTALGNLLPVDAEDKYATFDAVKTVVQNELAQTGKYTSTARTAITNLLTQYNNEVYHTVTSEEAALLGVTAGTVLKKTANNQTDGKTAALLNAVNEITQTASNIQQYSITFTVTKDGDQVGDTVTATVPYGTNYAFNISDIDSSAYTDDHDSVVWSCTQTVDGEPTVSNKINGYDHINKIVDTDLNICAAITSNQSAEGSYTYKIYNGNGKLVSIEYHDTSDVKDFPDAVSLVSIPFYTFSGWHTRMEENNTVTVWADYDLGSAIPFTAVNGSFTDAKGNTATGSMQSLYDKTMQLSYTGSDFYAWAVKVGEKYTVVSYTSDYTFYTHTALDFVPIIKVDDTYYFGTASEGNEVTAAKLASAPVQVLGSVDDFVTAKLNSKAPFIAVVGTKALTADNKYRAFVMVTKGSTYTGVGMKFNRNSTDDPMNETTKAIPTVLPTGQFSVTLSGCTHATFRATVNYDYTYSQAGGEATLNVTEISEMAN